MRARTALGFLMCLGALTTCGSSGTASDSSSAPPNTSTISASPSEMSQEQAMEECRAIIDKTAEIAHMLLGPAADVDAVCSEFLSASAVPKAAPTPAPDVLSDSKIPAPPDSGWFLDGDIPSSAGNTELIKYRWNNVDAARLVSYYSAYFKRHGWTNIYKDPTGATGGQRLNWAAKWRSPSRNAVLLLQIRDLCCAPGGSERLLNAEFWICPPGDSQFCTP